MESLGVLVDWLTNNESALSAVAALSVIFGISYGVLRFIFAPIFRNKDKSESSSKSTHDLVELETIADKIDHRFSIAVLLFETLSNDEDDEFLASGITSEIIAMVTTVPNIRVSSKLSSFGFKSGQEDIKKIAEQHNSNYVLTGSLRHAKNRILVIAKLTDIEQDTDIWSQTYDREINDLFDVQHEIATSIVGTVLGEVRVVEALFADSIPNHKIDAWGLVQKAEKIWVTSYTPEGIFEACDYLRQAIKIDPKYAKARATLAMMLAQQMTTRVCGNYDECADEARELIETAFKQSPNDLEVLANAGVVWQNLGDSERAELALRRVIEMAPLQLIPRGYLAMLLSFTGGAKEINEAKKLLEDNFTIAPKHPSTSYWLYFFALVEQRLGSHDSAIDYAKKSLMEQPGWALSYYIIANAYAMKGESDVAKEALENASEINPYLTTQLYAENVFRIVGSDKKSAPFVGGLKKLGLVK